jgi:hypothetical protein
LFEPFKKFFVVLPDEVFSLVHEQLAIGLGARVIDHAELICTRKKDMKKGREARRQRK